MPVASRLAEIARRQLGLASIEQLVEIGLSREAIRRRTVSGTLVKVGVHVYAVAGSPRTWEQSALAACLDRGEGALLSHLTAARVLHLDAPIDAAVHVTVPLGRTSRTPCDEVVIHRTRALATGDRSRCGPLPITSVRRTLVDLATMLGPTTLGRAVDDALCRRLVTPAELRQTVEQLAARRRRGAHVLTELLGPWTAGARMESVAEARFLRALLDAGLPKPQRQLVIADDFGVIGRVDFAWPGQMVLLEVDGFRWHANPASQAADSERSNRLAAAGWTVLRATPAELDRAPRAILAALRRHIAATA